MTDETPPLKRRSDAALSRMNKDVLVDHVIECYEEIDALKEKIAEQNKLRTAVDNFRHELEWL